MVNNTFTDNGTDAICVYAGTISTAGGWTSINYPYVTQGNITINESASLTVSPDVIVVLGGDITAAEGAWLTLSPGVIVKGKTNTRLIIGGILEILIDLDFF